MSKFLEELLHEDTLETLPEMERVHRTLRPKPTEGWKPWPIIFLCFQEKERVLTIAGKRSKWPLLMYWHCHVWQLCCQNYRALKNKKTNKKKNPEEAKYCVPRWSPPFFIEIILSHCFSFFSTSDRMVFIHTTARGCSSDVNICFFMHSNNRCCCYCDENSLVWDETS